MPTVIFKFFIWDELIFYVCQILDLVQRNYFLHTSSLGQRQCDHHTGDRRGIVSISDGWISRGGGGKGWGFIAIFYNLCTLLVPLPFLLSVHCFSLRTNYLGLIEIWSCIWKWYVCMYYDSIGFLVGISFMSTLSLLSRFFPFCCLKYILIFIFAYCAISPTLTPICFTFSNVSNLKLGKLECHVMSDTVTYLKPPLAPQGCTRNSSGKHPQKVSVTSLMRTYM